MSFYHRENAAQPEKEQHKIQKRVQYKKREQSITIIVSNANAACEPDKIRCQKKSQRFCQRETPVGKMAEEAKSQRNADPARQNDQHIPGNDGREICIHEC